MRQGSQLGESTTSCLFSLNQDHMERTSSTFYPRTSVSLVQRNHREEAPRFYCWNQTSDSSSHKKVQNSSRLRQNYFILIPFRSCNNPAKTICKFYSFVQIVPKPLKEQTQKPQPPNVLIEERTVCIFSFMTVEFIFNNERSNMLFRFFFYV